MSIKCQNCGAEIPDHIAVDQTALEEGEQAVTHSYPADDGFGVVTDYYCDPACAAEAFGDEDDEPEIRTDGGEDVGNRVSRHTVESSIRIGNRRSVRVEIDDGVEVHHISGDVEIEISGVSKDRPYTYELLEAIEQAVIETVDDFDGSSSDGATDGGYGVLRPAAGDVGGAGGD